MPLTWSQLRGQCRRLLKDEDATRYRWSDAQLLDYVGWALDSLCSHTAVATATGFVVDTETTQVILPDNVYEPIDRSGAIYLDDGTSTFKKYITPVRYSRVSQAASGYYLQPQNTVNFVRGFTTGGDLTVQYFAYYNHPVLDSDTVDIPTWATAAVVYRIGAYALSPYAARSANIRQWNEKQDSGNPEHNPLERMAEAFLRAWEEELRNYPVQQRENYFTT